VRDYDNTLFSFRLKNPEAVRFWELMDKAKERNAYIDKADVFRDVFRELVGITKPNLLTREEIEYFRTGKKL
jgi:hypothetical protein